MHGGRAGGFGLTAAGALALALLCAPAPARADGPRLHAQLDRSSASVGDQVTLTITLEGFSQRAGQPEIPPLPDVHVYDTGRSTNIQLVNGRLSSSTSYTYVLMPGQAGTFTIGPISVTDKGTAYTTEPLTLTVVAGRPGAAPAPRGAADAGESAAAAGEGLFARLTAEPRDACVGEQISLVFRLYQREDVPLAELNDFQPPATEGFWREDLGPEREYSVEMNGRTYQVREIRWALFATRPGDLEVGPASIVGQVAARSRGRGGFGGFFGSGFLDRQAVPLQTGTVPIHVRPLPETGRPDGFTGSVGDYRLEAHFDAPRANRGEPFTLTAKVSGTGHIQTVGAPVWPSWDGLRVYDSGEAVSVEKGGDRIGGEKSFTQVLIASRAGRVRLDPVRFVYYDPAKERYLAIETAPLEIEVQEGGAGAGIGDERVSLGDDILYIHTDIASGLRRAAGPGSGGAWVALAAPFALVGGAAWLRRRRTAAESDPAFGRRSRALRAARRALAAIGRDEAPAAGAARVAALLEAYLSDWLDLPVRGTTRGELRAALLESGLDGELAARVGGILDRTEEIRFGAGAGGADGPARLTRDADALLGELEAAWRRRRA